jgi:hypothetical protein
MSRIARFKVGNVDYYKQGDVYYADNMIIREKITLKEFKYQMMQSLIEA